MKFNFSLLLFSLLSCSALAGDEIHCQAKLQLVEFKSLPVQSCKMAEALVSNNDVKEYQKERIYNKLAKKLSTQIEQNLEEMAILDQFYTANKHDLMMDSDAIKNNCRLGHAKTLETNCPGQKLNILKTKFSNEGDSLSSKLAAKFTASRNIGKDKNQCPIQGDFGAFILSAQLDSKTMMNFIDVAKTNQNDPDEKQFTAWLDQNPQFKLIVKTGDKNFKKKFKNYLASFSGNPEEARDYVSQFFFQPDNQKILSLGLADQCEKINRNLETFLCKDLDQLGSLDKTASQELFGLDPDVDLKDMFDIPNDDSIYAAYGFQCLAHEEAKKTNNEKKNSIDHWFNKFNENIRPTFSESQTKNASIGFCSIYQCKTPEISDTDSCKKGGPVSVADLNKKFGCPGGRECSDAVLKYISFLDTLDKDKTQQSSSITSSGKTSSSDNQSSSSSKSTRYSAFTENLLGVEGTLAAEGKAITPITIAEKQKDFVERKLDPTPATRDVKMEKAVAQAPIAQPTMNQATVTDAPAQTLTTSSSSRFEANDTSATSNAIRGVRTAKTTTSTKDFSSSSNTSERDAEIKRLRDELNSVMTSMKGTENDKLNTAIDHNSKYSPPSYGGSSKSNPYQGLNSSEKDRLDQYQKNLNAWENRLQNWQNNLATGDISRAPTTASDAIAKRNDSNESSMKGSRGESSIQLTSSDKSDKDNKGKNGKASGTNANGTNADAPEAVLNSDELASLSPSALKKLGINFKSSFLMKIRYKEKFYEIPVKSFSYKGKDVLVPLLSDKNSSLSKIVLDSPLFSDYKQMQIDRQKERSAYAEALN